MEVELEMVKGFEIANENYAKKRPHNPIERINFEPQMLTSAYQTNLQSITTSRPFRLNTF
jgi:hypothetical protein